MGIFDRWRKRADTPERSPAREANMVVPDGHRVDIHRMRPLPGVARSAAGVWLAFLGVSSDEKNEELDSVLGEVQELVDGPRPQILLAAVHGPLSSLMAPADPALTPLSGHLVWCLDAAALAGAPRAPALLQRLLRQMQIVSRAAITQTVFAVNHDGAPAVVTLIRELGIEVREPDPKEGAILAEVHRPEGVVLSALIGAPLGEAPAALEAHLGHENGARRITAVDRAPRLRRLLLAVAEKDGAVTRKALYEELRGREVPLLLMVDPKTRGAAMRSWPDGFEAMAVYGDNASLLTSARDLGLPMGSFGAAEMTPAQLFAWGAGHGWAVAICVFRESGEPVYVRIPADEVRALAAEKMQ